MTNRLQHLFCAGRAYNTYPLMDGKIMPVSDMFTLHPLWRNFFENTATVQVKYGIGVQILNH